jgi:sugar lactone lactonase YvrE
MREAFTWSDDSGAQLRVDLVGGRVVRWALERHAEPQPAPAGAPAAPAAAAE